MNSIQSSDNNETVKTVFLFLPVSKDQLIKQHRYSEISTRGCTCKVYTKPHRHFYKYLMTLWQTFRRPETGTQMQHKTYNGPAKCQPFIAKMLNAEDFQNQIVNLNWMSSSINVTLIQVQQGRDYYSRDYCVVAVSLSTLDMNLIRSNNSANHATLTLVSCPLRRSLLFSYSSTMKSYT